MGHIALAGVAGVAVGVFTHQAPVLTALVFAVVAAVSVEPVRARGRTSGDVALAVMFYGGIALGVVVFSMSGDGTPTNLDSYLFGSISTTTDTDLKVFAALAVVVVALTWALRPRLFVVSNDEEYARATGMRVTALNITLAVLPAVTVVVAMRVVGLLLIQCPDDRAERHRPAGRQQLPVSDPHSRGHRSDLQRGWRDDVVLRRHPSGGTIVLLAIALFLMAASHSALHDRIARRQHLEAEQHQHEHGANCGHPAIPHEHHVDYRHDGHRHAPHESHYDEHDLPKTHNDLVRH